MTQTRWTPGPWEWHCAKHKDGRNNGSVIADAQSGRARCVCKAPQYEKDEQWQANAHLIAAAPLMYEALDRLLNDAVYVNRFASTKQAKHLAEKALRTARGETQEHSA